MAMEEAEAMLQPDRRDIILYFRLTCIALGAERAHTPLCGRQKYG